MLGHNVALQPRLAGETVATAVAVCVNKGSVTQPAACRVRGFCMLAVTVDFERYLLFVQRTTGSAVETEHVEVGDGVSIKRPLLLVRRTAGRAGETEPVLWPGLGCFIGRLEVNILPHS